jgi:IS30 family transposase
MEIMAGKNSSVLRLDEREQIEKGIKMGDTNAMIARILGRCISCIKQEIAKNGGRERYNAKDSEDRSRRRRENKNSKLSKVFSPDEEQKIREMINSGASMNKICLEMGIRHFRLRKFIDRNNIDFVPQNYIGFDARIGSLEMQVQILTEQLKELLCKK